jgi:transcriptional regulator with XRE-family HTH domain
VAGAQSPTVRRRRLALELRRLREAAKLTCEEVAEQLECSASKISRVETGRVSVSPRDVRDMLEIYGVPEPQRDALVQLARESRQKGWWHAYADSLQPHVLTYLGMETAASEIRIYEVNLIPGLLQTEEYARAVINAGVVTSPRFDVERQVAVKMERQRLAMTSPQVWAVLDEAALRRQVGGPEVMRVILAFSEEADPDVVYLKNLTGALWVENVEEVDRYNLFFNHLQATALSFENSAALMTAVLKEM